MGADMLLSVLWRSKENHGKPLDIDTTLANLRKLLEKETDKATFDKALAFATGEEYDEEADLISEVMWAVKTNGGEGIEPTYDLIIKGYRSALEDLQSSFNSREVTTIWATGAIGYATGGMSYGDDTDAANLWNRILFDSDAEYGGNPYADFLYDSLFIEPTLYPKSEVESLRKKILEQEALIRELSLSRS